MQRDFARNNESLAPLYDFAEDVFAANGVAEAVRFPVHLAMEELFVNMVKYNPEVHSDIGVELTVAKSGAVTVVLVDDGGVEFDVTKPRNVDTEAPLQDRTPGGLGIHLIQNLTDELKYEYKDGRGRVIFTKESG